MIALTGSVFVFSFVDHEDAFEISDRIGDGFLHRSRCKAEFPDGFFIVKVVVGFDGLNGILSKERYFMNGIVINTGKRQNPFDKP